MSQKAITSLTATELSQNIHMRKISCLEVMQAYLEQIQKMNLAVNAIISMLPEKDLLAHAKLKDEIFHQVPNKGFLYGFPLAPKDLTGTKGIVTAMGSPIFKHQVNAQDSIVVERMKASGGILIGKTNVPEFGLGSHTYNTVFGTTLNSYDPSKSAGGSSGGTAVALSLDMLPIGDGSDFGGSLRNPSAWNNVYGLRPSIGRVPLGPTQEFFFDQFSTEGPMAKNITDLAMMLSIQAGHDTRSPLSLRQDPNIFTQALDAHLKGKKIAWMGDLGGYLPMEKGVLEQSCASLKYFEQIGCAIEEVVPQFDMAALWKSWLVLRAYSTGGRLMPLYKNLEHRKLLKPEAIWEVEQSLHLTAHDIYAASVTRTSWTKELNRLLQYFDALVLPSAQVFAFDQQIDWPKSIDGNTMDTYHRWMEVVIGATLAGLPVLAIPAGFHLGVPFGLQVIGKPAGEFELMQLGFGWEKVTPFQHHRSPLLQ